MRRAALLAVMVLCLAAPARGAERQVHETRRYDVGAGATVLLDVADMQVDLRAADIPDVAVTTELRISGVSEERAARWVEGHTPLVDAVGEGLSIRVPSGRYGFLGLGMLTAKAHLGVVMTPKAVPDITTTSGDIRVRGDFPKADPLRFRSATGDIEFEGAAPSVDVRTSSGDARLKVVRPLERLFVRSASGDVTLSGGARNVHVDTASGNVWLANLSGSAEIQTSTGKVTVRWDRLDPAATVVVSNHSGRIRLVLPDGVRPKGTASTTSGRIRCALSGTVSQDGTTVTLEGDGPKFQVTTVSGEIVIDTGTAGWEVTVPGRQRPHR